MIVVDDGSQADYGDTFDHLDFDVQVLRREHAGPASARNLGVSIATGDYIVFLDDDCIPSQDYLRDLRRELAARPELDAIGGDVEALEPDGLVTSFFVQFGKIDHQRVEPYGWQLVTANAIFRREAFLAVGGFDARYREAAGEDWDLCRRLAANGALIDRMHGATVYHDHPRTVSQLMVTARRYRDAMPMLAGTRSKVVGRRRRGTGAATTVPASAVASAAGGCRTAAVFAARSPTGPASFASDLSIRCGRGPTRRSAPTSIWREGSSPRWRSWRGLHRTDGSSCGPIACCAHRGCPAGVHCG